MPPSSGVLQVRVFTSIAQLPLAGATIIITQQTPSGKYDLVSVQATDSSGMIRPVTIATPSTDQSGAPAAAGSAPPFALCDIWAERSGYGMQTARDVQIFSGIETMQEFRLPPLYAGQADLTRQESQTIPVQDL